MSAVQVPAELIERTATLLNNASRRFHRDADSGVVFDDCDRTLCQGARVAVAELRALLPQPAPTCPNCGHGDDEHTGYCEMPSAETGVDKCGCLITSPALDTVRALLAAERDSKPAQRQPRVWWPGDPEPEIGTIFDDRDRDRYQRHDGGWYALINGKRVGVADTWSYRLEYAPLIEVRDGGDQR